jgi:L-threonylcarbamoyladenylate synthase
VHAADSGALDELAIRIPLAARHLAERFWPGPLTLVLERNPGLPSSVTGGQATVAVRVPAHPLALELLRGFGGAIAAPSANRFGGVSPTTAQHVRDDLGADVDYVLDGGPCEVGLESTIVDLTGTPAVVLRLGGVTEEALSDALGERVVSGTRAGLRVPGNLPSHYAPAARVILVEPAELARRVSALGAREGTLGVLAPQGVEVPVGVCAHILPADPMLYAHALYATLREFDASGCKLVLVVPPAAHGLGRAVIDRLERAAAPRPGDAPDSSALVTEAD